jgi:Trk K+ transport system NAD-binding subunit
VKVLNEVLTTAHGSAFHTLEVPAHWVGNTVGKLHEELFRKHRASMLSIEDDGGNLDVNPDPNRIIQANEKVVVLSKAEVPVRW